MPLPCSSYARFFKDHFGVVVVNLATEKNLHAVNNSERAGYDSHCVVSGMVPARESNTSTLSISNFKGAFKHHLVSMGSAGNDSSFLFIQEIRHKDETILLKLALFFSETGVHHRRPSFTKVFFSPIAWPQS